VASLTRTLRQSVYTNTYVVHETTTAFQHDGLGQVTEAETRTKANTPTNANRYAHDASGTTDRMQVRGQRTMATVGLDHRVSQEDAYQDGRRTTRLYRYDNEGRLIERVQVAK
jgi:hypothetical protein